VAKKAGTVPGTSTSKISNHHSAIINPSLAIPACQRAPKRWYFKNKGTLPGAFAITWHWTGAWVVDWNLELKPAPEFATLTSDRPSEPAIETSIESTVQQTSFGGSLKNKALLLKIELRKVDPP
jgi:hypothetical protein